MLDPDNIGVEILVLYSVALISNVGLLTSEALYSESNEKYSTFNEEPCTINDGVETILIGDFCFFLQNNGLPQGGSWKETQIYVET